MLCDTVNNNILFYPTPIKPAVHRHVGHVVNNAGKLVLSVLYLRWQAVVTQICSQATIGTKVALFIHDSFTRRDRQVVGSLKHRTR